MESTPVSVAQTRARIVTVLRGVELEKDIVGYFDYVWECGETATQKASFRSLPPTLSMKLQIALKKKVRLCMPRLKVDIVVYR